MSTQQIPPAIRGCQFCGCPADKIKLLGNPVADIMKCLRLCNRYCPICTAQAPIDVWDGTDPKCKGGPLNTLQQQIDDLECQIEQAEYDAIDAAERASIDLD